MKRTAKRTGEHGVALVTTMIVVAVLAVVAVAFMQSTGMDRLSSRTAVGYAQARFAAMAGASAAEAAVVRAVTAYPDSATVWQNIGGASTNEATVLYVRAAVTNTNTGSKPGQFGEEIRLLAQPLVSGGTLVPLANIGNAMPYVSSDTNMTDLNATNQSYTEPFIGTRSVTNAAPRPVTAARWVYVTKFPGAVNATNPYVARYAYWVEDESFKLNINVATNGARGNTTNGLSDEERFFFERSGPDQLRVDGSWGASRNNALKGADFAGAVAGREDASFASAATAAFGARISDPAAVAELRFLTTAYSAGLDLTRGGVKRFNLNSLTNGIGSPQQTNEIRASLDRFIAAITNTNAAPLFGQRFYRPGRWWTVGNTNTRINLINSTNLVTNVNVNIPGFNQHEMIYLNKLAANVMDYIDINSQPTITKVPQNPANLAAAVFPVLAGTVSLTNTNLPTYPLFNEGTAGEGTNRIAAFGVETRPYLFEYAIVVQLTNMTPRSYPTSAPPANRPKEASFGFLLDHCFTFWNPSTKDIVVGNGNAPGAVYLGDAFLEVANAPGWIDRAAVKRLFEPGSRDFRLGLPAGARFPAGQTTVVTTLPAPEARGLLPGASNIVSVYNISYDDKRKFEDSTTDVETIGTNRFFRLSLDYRASASSPATQLDYETEVLLGNSSGILEMFPALTVGSLAILATNSPPVTFYRMSNLKGNRPPTANRVVPNDERSTPTSVSGDHRTLNEQLEIRPANSAGNNRTSFFTDNTATNDLGKLLTRWVDSTAWIDYSSLGGNRDLAPLIVRNAGMRSIGELGHITDPIRYSSAVSSDTNQIRNTVLLPRAGGRTLRVGQPEVFHTNTNRAGLWWDGNTNTNSWWIGNQTNASRTWTAWRLADIFTVNVNTNFPVSDTNAALRALQVPGLINPNGALRDDGAALRAALFGFRFLGSPDGGLASANRPLTNATQVATIMSNVAFRLTNTNSWTPAGAVNPMWERGEMSEFPFLNSGTTFGFNMSNNFDRGREEVIRRSIEMITTRGSIFTAYVVGQSLNGTNVTGTVRLKQTFEITPQFPTTEALRDDFNAAQAVWVTRRFAAPTNYTTRVLSSFYD